MIRAIDVSANQGRIDWERVPSSIDYVILRATTKNHKADLRFVENVAALNKKGVPYDAYKYVYAKTVEEINEEIFHVIKAIQENGAFGHVKRIWLDVEDCGLTAEADELSKLVDVGRMAIENNGFYAGVYTNYMWLKNGRFNAPEGVPVWVARYPSGWMEFKPTDSPPEFSYVGGVDWTGWQYTSRGNVPGIVGAVDLNIFEEDILMPHWEPRPFLENVLFGESFSDALEEIGEDGSFENRKKIAVRNGMSEYSGKADENLELLSRLRKGELLRL